MRDWSHRLDAYFLSFCRRVFRWSPAYKQARATALFSKRSILVNGKRKQEETYYCAKCKEIFIRKETRVDHVEPVIPIKGWDRIWTTLKDRMSFENPKNLQVLCIKCHNLKTKKENEARRAWRKSASTNT